MKSPEAMTFPPGPRRPAIVQVLQWGTRPVAFLDECARRFGDLFTVRFAGLGAAVFVTSPALIKQVFTADPDVLHAGEANEILRPVLGSSSVLLLDGAAHLRQRRLLMPPFHGERIASYAELIREITEARLAAWPAGSPFAIHPAMQAMTLDIITPIPSASSPSAGSAIGSSIRTRFSRSAAGSGAASGWRSPCSR